MWLSRMWKTMQISEDAIHQGRKPNILRDLHNSSRHTKAEFNNCFISHSKFF